MHYLQANTPVTAAHAELVGMVILMDMKYITFYSYMYVINYHNYTQYSILLAISSMDC